ncbi:uncharacterized protein LOC128242322 [Mya arenaria]|uniref:uncharacterized protein LOC128242322 n=1 Tax=Mya arenaria TaxID=6604 RepID=UPI0022E3FFDF|nr:uncharacterized protein LOC128242322 [Mya arenaria]
MMKLRLILKYRSKKYLRCLVVILLLTFMIYCNFTVRHVYRNSGVAVACSIPRLDPFDASILPYVWEPAPLTCDAGLMLLVSDPKGLIQWNDTALRLAGIGKGQLPTCIYRVIELGSDFKTKYGPEITFRPPAVISSEFFQVICKNSKGEAVFERIFSVIHEGIGKNHSTLRDDNPERLSVVLLGIDSVSRSAAIRKLPRTVKYLTEELGSYDFRGMMKVGDNTFPNLVVQQAGVLDPEDICLYSECDRLPLIWRNFSARSYVTMFAEDWGYEATFTNHRPGFRSPPTDHYMRNFWLALEEQAAKVGVDTLKSMLYPLEWTNLKSQGALTARRLCYKDEFRYKILLNYLKQFMTVYKSKQRYALTMVNSVAHQVDNFVSYADEGYLDILKWLKENGHLKNTMLVFFSDHGSRLERIRNTLVGRLEDRMPVLHVVLPDHIKHKYPHIHNNLIVNKDRLISHWDVYKTLEDVLNGNFKAKTDFLEKPGGISLFREIPPGRSCVDAGIPDMYCACNAITLLDPRGSPAVQSLISRLQAHMIKEINGFLENHKECAKLRVHKVHEVRHLSNGLHYATSNYGFYSTIFGMFMSPEDASVRYELVLQTSPGCGLFEATYRLSPAEQPVRLGNIIRINRYGSQANCMDVGHLRVFCYCGNETTPGTGECSGEKH